ncbi:MAG: hypothetical protein CSA97_04390 [Bacteroidetes bacterium]|nr:MAG: hypothetical protein CSA97_04390 [Bacteroidota bacterium]
MRRLGRSIVIFLTLFLAGNAILGCLLDLARDRTQDRAHITSKLRYLRDSVDAELICIGTSRTLYHCVPQVLEDSLGYSVYNAGINNSQEIYSQWFVLNLILSHHTPKLILLDLYDRDFPIEPGWTPFARNGFFSPFMGTNDSADVIFHAAGDYWYYRFSSGYRYNTRAMEIIEGLWLRGDERYYDRGFTYRGKRKYDELPYPSERFGPVDSAKIRYIKRFADLCKRSGINLVLTVAPVYKDFGEGAFAPLAQMAEEMGIPFLNYYERKLFHDSTDYFNDYMHLDSAGAVAYSRVLASDLRKLGFGR